MLQYGCTTLGIDVVHRMLFAIDIATFLSPADREQAVSLRRGFFFRRRLLFFFGKDLFLVFPLSGCGNLGVCDFSVL